jgi:succinyl-diaminopimelate desuccinylase
MDRSIVPDTSEEEAAELLSELVSIDSQNPPGREEPVAEYIVETLTDWGIDARLLGKPDPDRPQVVAEVGAGDSDATTLALNGHMDVVPPGDEAQWTVDPFEGVVRDGRVYGRGTSDMKGGIAAAMLAARAAHRSGEVDGTLLLLFAMGEETAEPGTKTLLSEVGNDIDVGVVLEPTELTVDTAGKGLAWYTAAIDGESCHASRPALGTNALSGLLSIDDALAAYQERIAERTHPLIGRSLCTPTMADAGIKENVIPDRAELRFDRRFLPDEDVETLDQEMDELFEGLRDRGYDVRIERTRTYEAAEIDTDAEIARVFRRHSHDVAGVDTAPHGKDAATDQRNFVNDADVPAIIWGPGSPSQSHTADEWARTDLLVDAVEVLSRATAELCTA